MLKKRMGFCHEGTEKRQNFSKEMFPHLHPMVYLRVWNSGILLKSRRYAMGSAALYLKVRVSLSIRQLFWLR
jgi:hypothetical protein